METMVVEWFKEKRNYIYVCFFKISYISINLMPTFQGWAGGVCWHNSCGIHVDLMTLIHPKTLPILFLGLK